MWDNPFGCCEAGSLLTGWPGFAVELAVMNMMICLDLVGNPQVLDKIGIKPEDKEKILTEAQVVIEQAK
jgi:hypothetical protein